MAGNLYSQTPASNDMANYFQTNMLPSKVKIAGWDIMADIATWNGLPTSGGSANAQTITNTNQYTALVSGLLQGTFIPGFTNTGAMTLAIDGLTAKSVFCNGAAAIAGMIVSGVPARWIYDGTNIHVLNPQRSTGSATGTPTGFSGSPGTCTLTYTVLADGHTVYVTVGTGITGTSSATTFTITGLPSFLAPSVAQQGIPTFVRDAGANGTGNIQMNSGSSTITLANGSFFSSGNFTASGTKAFPNGGAANFSYQI